MPASFPNSSYLSKSNIAFICILGMFTGFLVSPAVLSISMMLFGVSSLRDVHPKRWLENKWWLLGVLWIAFYALAYFWSTDKEVWGISLQVKLPFLLLPLAFAYTPRFSQRQLQLLTVLMGLFLLAGACYSVSFLIIDPELYIRQYRVSHLLPTPARGDHISFSLAITLYMIWAVYCWPYLQNRSMKVLTTLMIVLLGLYLHVLAAKSGLVSLYLFLGLWSLYLAFTKHKAAGIALIVAIPLFLVLAVNFIPTLGIRKDYVSYSFLMGKLNDRSGNYGDVNRLMATKMAVQVIKGHPLNGIGTGDMLSEMKKVYQQWYPQVRDEDVLIPHNQFLIVALGCGIPAMIVFVIWIFMPLTWLKKNRQSFFFFLVWLILMLQLFIDTALEAQMAVFIFVFFILLQKKELDHKNKELAILGH